MNEHEYLKWLNDQRYFAESESPEMERDRERLRQAERDNDSETASNLYDSIQQRKQESWARKINLEGAIQNYELESKLMDEREQNQ